MSAELDGRIEDNLLQKRQAKPGVILSGRLPESYTKNANGCLGDADLTQRLEHR